LVGVHTLRIGESPEIIFNLRFGGPSIKLVGLVTIEGPGLLHIEIPLELTGDVTNARIENFGQIIAWGTGNQINGPYSAGSGAGIRVEGRDPCEAEYGPGACGKADLTIGLDFTNNGPLVLTSVDNVYSAALVMPEGTTLTNQAEISAQLGTGGARYLFVQLDNFGAVRITSPELLLIGSGPSAAHVNRPGNATAGRGLLDATMGSLTLMSAASLNNQGTINVGT